MQRLLIIANRLPVQVEVNNEINFKRSAGGLATGLSSLEGDWEKHWVGWPGIYPEKEELKQQISAKLEEDDIHPVYLTPGQIEDYYKGFSNKTIWPLFHYFAEYTRYDSRTWETYQEVNQLFCDKVLEVAQEDDIIWVHDYHLMLLPQLLRQHLPKARIGYFLHIPFPSYELFRTLPWRRELLEGLLGSDFIAFHTFEYMRHFSSAIYRILGHEPHLGQVNLGSRTVTIDALPMGIDYEKFHQKAQTEAVQNLVRSYRRQFGEFKLVLSVDRLDYSKGILQRLKGLAYLLEHHPEWQEKVSLIMLVVPSRDTVEHYRLLKEEIDETVGRINGEFSTMTWTPIHYFYRSVPFQDLVALYKMADVALVTPYRDGMNLVAKEYVASHHDGRGVLVLSEMAGSAIELPEAVTINPNDIIDITGGLNEALTMEEEEQRWRLDKMRARLEKQTVQKWANDFIRLLNQHYKHREEQQVPRMAGEQQQQMVQAFKTAKKRLIFLDYDGTLVSFHKNPEDAVPTPFVLELLEDLTADSRNQVVIISGRDHKSLDKWLGQLPVALVAEHGIWFKEAGEWRQKVKQHEGWKTDICKVMEQFVERTPGSFIEAKDYSLAWHYRKTDSWLADIRVRDLINSLLYPTNKHNLQILDGNKVVEVKVSGIDKGRAAQQWLKKDRWDFVLALGDDRTDEDTFRALPDSAYTIKIGQGETAARYNLRTHHEVLELLDKLAYAEVPIKEQPIS